MAHSRVREGSEATDSKRSVTDLLKRWEEDSVEPSDEPLLKSLYNDVKGIAQRRLRGEGKRPFDTTDLAHECFVRLMKQRSMGYEDRKHFFGIVGRILRQILVDEARKRMAEKRAAPTIAFDEAMALPGDKHTGGTQVRILDLNEALDRLGEADSRQVTVVNLRFFGGMTVREIAKELDIAESTVKLDWKYAKAQLLRSLSDKEV